MNLSFVSACGSLADPSRHLGDRFRFLAIWVAADEGAVPLGSWPGSQLVRQNGKRDGNNECQEDWLNIGDLIVRV